MSWVRKNASVIIPSLCCCCAATGAPFSSAIEIASGRLFAGRPPAWTLPRQPHRRSPGAKRPLRRGFNRVPELWDPATGQEVRRFVGHTGTIGLAGAIAFIPDDKRVLTTSTDGAARLWDVEIADTVADLCSRLQRDFTPRSVRSTAFPTMDRPVRSRQGDNSHAVSQTRRTDAPGRACWRRVRLLARGRWRQKGSDSRLESSISQKKTTHPCAHTARPAVQPAPVFRAVQRQGR